MSTYSTVYSEYGLRKMIADNEKKLAENQAEYDAAEQKFNPEWVHGMKTEIAIVIKATKENLARLNEALDKKLSMTKDA